MDEIGRLLDEQHGTISRRQLLSHGLSPASVRRLLRRRELVAVHPGAYVDHTGPLTWQQRAWSAVHACWPAALTHESSLRAAEGPGSRRTDGPIHVAVSADRRLAGPDGVVIHRLEHFDELVQWNLGPPRVRLEPTVLHVAIDHLRAGRTLDAVAELARQVGRRSTTAERLAHELSRQARVTGRDLLAGVMDDLAGGTCSVLEHGYLTLVERPHGLRARGRQVRDHVRGSRIYRDVEYDDLVVELDGWAFHATAAQHDADLDRDLETLAGGKRTVRLGWGQVYGRPCRTAASLARAMPAADAYACSPDCPVV